MGGTITVGRIGGIPVRIHVSWVFILAIMIWSLGAVGYPNAYPHWSKQAYWTTATVASLLLFVCVLLHELSHSLVSRMRGIKVEGITLMIFGGVTQISEEARTAGAEFAIAVVGPVTSIALGLILLAAGYALSGLSQQVKAVIEYLATVNIILGVFNLLPGLPLDGGRVLRAMVWGRTKNPARATEITSSVSRRIGMMMIIGGILITFTSASLEGLWIAFLGWYIESAAGASKRQLATREFLEGVRVRDVMRTDFRTVVPALPVEQLVDEYIVDSHQRSFPVFGGGHLWGIVTLADVARVPRHRWSDVPVEQIMTPREKLRTTTAEAPLEEAIGDLQPTGVKQLVVFDEGSERVIGMVSREDLMDFLQVRRLVFKTPEPVRA